MPIQRFTILISRFPDYWDTLGRGCPTLQHGDRGMSQRHKRIKSDRESGFHEQSDFQPSPEETQLLSFKPQSTGNNSNHVSHKVIRGSRKLKAPTPSPAHTDMSQFSFQSSSTYGTSDTSFPEMPSLPVSPLTDARVTVANSSSATNTSTAAYGRMIVNKDFIEEEVLQHDCKTCGCERIKINVSGQYFEMRVGILNMHPTTLLGNPLKRQQFYDRVRDEFFIDRHRPSFEAIFAYFQYGGKLKRPHNVPDDVFLSELYFYELEDDVVGHYKHSEGYTSDEIVLPQNKTLQQIWMLFEYPETSRLALVIAVISVILTIASIVLFCVETLPVFADSHCVVDEAPNFLDPFFVIETMCTLWFTFEVIIRFIACPNKLTFWKDFKNLVDVTAIIPYYVTFINVVSTMSCASAKSSASLAFLRVIRLIRVFKLTKHSTGLQILMLTFKASIEGLGLFLIALVVCLLVFSSAIYFAELGEPGTQIDSIPDAFWWAIITMTTVGYGDKVPVGTVGKLIGSMCAITGVLTLAIPVPIITGHFNRFYAHKTGRGRHT